MSRIRALGAAIHSRIRHVVLTPLRLYRSFQRVRYDLRHGHRTLGDVGKDVVMTALGVVMLLVLLFPIYWVLTASLSDGARLLSSESIFPDPAGYNLDAYRWVIFESDFFFQDGDWGYPAIAVGTDGLIPIGITWLGTETGPGALFNSLYLVSVTVTAAFAMILPGAYALSRRSFIGRRKVLYGYILFTQIGSGLSIATLVALFALFSNFGLTNNLFVLGLFYAATAVPFNTWLLKTYMDSIPVSYEEAAMVDGAGFFQTVREIILPLSKPGLAVILIFCWLAGWNEFVIAQTMLRPENYPLSVELYLLLQQGRYSIPWSRFAAFASLFALPVALLYFFAQNYVESGLSFGGMEG
jgi:arabinogalactan oligomer/maltooligosaccharide transport system permease protein